LLGNSFLIQDAAEQIKWFGGVNTRAVVRVGWCTWSPSALSVTPWFGPEHQLGVIGPYFFEEEGVTVTVNSERYVAMLRNFLQPRMEEIVEEKELGGGGGCGSNWTELQLTQLEIQ
jgi:hypothetical protein